jgi:predicted phage tail protein
VALVGTLGLRIDFQWQPIQNITRYEAQARKTGTTTLVLNQVTGATRVEFYGERDAVYEVRVRALTSCGTQGAWSNWIPITVNDPLVPGFDPVVSSNVEIEKLISVP